MVVESFHVARVQFQGAVQLFFGFHPIASKLQIDHSEQGVRFGRTAIELQSFCQ